ncbi:hypothetical protein M422DRAFT_252504 [Sphaerobolus stellatus SS14]|uniref:Uncharacterized protein n=1 Tax=Sphaerobolus stellatus (strain SS14) TaxID=990650 RepID=A0A0C9VYD9_SPHS4|nr:hypothetical protein M422DRAFT_252504 [Sphaerobolus stellatus SS14]
MSHRRPTSISHTKQNYNKQNIDLEYFTLIPVKTSAIGLQPKLLKHLQNKMRIANGSTEKTVFKKMIHVFVENEGATVPNWQYEKLLCEDSFIEKNGSGTSASDVPACTHFLYEGIFA